MPFSDNQLQMKQQNKQNFLIIFRFSDAIASKN